MVADFVAAVLLQCMILAFFLFSLSALRTYGINFVSAHFVYAGQTKALNKGLFRQPSSFSPSFRVHSIFYSSVQMVCL